MTKNTWRVALVALVTSAVIYMLLFLGFLLDVKYQIEGVSEIGTRFAPLFYRHIYIVAGIVALQYIAIVYLLYRLRKYRSMG